MKNQQLAVKYGHENSYFIRNHNSRRRELWNLQSLKNTSTQTVIRRATLHSAHDLPCGVIA
jgi:hypothetical protein